MVLLLVPLLVSLLLLCAQLALPLLRLSAQLVLLLLLLRGAMLVLRWQPWPHWGPLRQSWPRQGPPVGQPGQAVGWLGRCSPRQRGPWPLLAVLQLLGWRPWQGLLMLRAALLLLGWGPWQGLLMLRPALLLLGWGPWQGLLMLRALLSPGGQPGQAAGWLGRCTPWLREPWPLCAVLQLLGWRPWQGLLMLRALLAPPGWQRGQSLSGCCGCDCCCCCWGRGARCWRRRQL